MNTNENTTPLSVQEAMEFIMADATPQQAVGYAETLDDAREGARHATMQAATRWDELAYAAEVAWGVCLARGYPGATGLAAEEQAPTLKTLQREIRPDAQEDAVRRWKRFSRTWEHRCDQARQRGDRWKAHCLESNQARDRARAEARNWRLKALEAQAQLNDEEANR